MLQPVITGSCSWNPPCSTLSLETAPIKIHPARAPLKSVSWIHTSPPKIIEFSLRCFIITSLSSQVKDWAVKHWFWNQSGSTRSSARLLRVLKGKDLIITKTRVPFKIKVLDRPVVNLVLTKKTKPSCIISSMNTVTTRAPSECHPRLSKVTLIKGRTLDFSSNKLLPWKTSRSKNSSRTNLERQRALLCRVTLALARRDTDLHSRSTLFRLRIQAWTNRPVLEKHWGSLSAVKQSWWMTLCQMISANLCSFSTRLTTQAANHLVK